MSIITEVMVIELPIRDGNFQFFADVPKSDPCY